MKMELFKLEGKCALVTGAAGGLGYAVAEGLAEAGASLILIDADTGVHESADKLRGLGGDVLSLECDLTNRSHMSDAVETAKNCASKGIQVLVNAAGIQRRYATEQFPLDEWDLVIETNLTACFKLSKLLASEMISRGYGKIINITSIMANFGGTNIPAYAASKGGLAQLTKSCSNAWAKAGVRVNAIAPGYFDTNLNLALLDDRERMGEIQSRTPLGRLGAPADIKGAAVFLASPASDYITGSVLTIDGGYSAR